MSSEPSTKSDFGDILAYEANNLPVNPKPQVALVGLRVDRRFKSPSPAERQNLGLGERNEKSCFQRWAQARAGSGSHKLRPAQRLVQPEVKPAGCDVNACVTLTSASAFKFFLPLARAMHAPTVKKFEPARADVSATPAPTGSCHVSRPQPSDQHIRIQSYGWAFFGQ